MKYNQPYGVSDPEAPYVNGNPSTGTMGSIPPAASIEYDQREIVNVIKAAGLTPTNNDVKQLAKGIQNGKLYFGVDTGSANQLAITLDPIPDALIPGMTVHVLIANDNTGPSVLIVNGVTRPIKLVNGEDVPAGRLLDGMMMQLMYDGTNWQMLSEPAGGGGLIKNMDYYVNDATGSDTLNDGLTASTPFKTLQRAVTETIKYNLNGYGITIHVANGTYAPVNLLALNGSGIATIVGDQTTPANVIISAATGAAVNCHADFWYLKGVKMQSAAADAVNGLPGSGINMFNRSYLVTYDVEFGACPAGDHITCRDGHVDLRETTRLAGNAESFINVQYGGFVATVGNVPPCNLVIPGAITFSQATVRASSMGMCYPVFPNGITGGGNVTGKRYDATGNAIINVNGAGASYIPGTVAGTTATGGQLL